MMHPVIRALFFFFFFFFSCWSAFFFEVLGIISTSVNFVPELYFEYY